MSKAIRWLMVSMLLWVSQPLPWTAAAGSQQQASAPGIILLGFKGSTGAVGELMTSLDAPVESLTNPELAAIGVAAVRVPVGGEQRLLADLRQDPRILFAEPDYQAHTTSQQSPFADTIPNDPFFNQQWSLARIHAPLAWSYTVGDPAVTIAMLDSGIQLEHPDLSAKLWVNPGEIAGNGIDDDGNGKVDDIHGWHFYHQYTSNGYLPEEDGFVDDDLGHGTHVSGIAAAATDNSQGIAGISWGSPLMPVKVIDEFGYGWYSDIAAGIVYAVDNGARVINLSLGGEQSSATLEAAVDYAVAHGVAMVASAGNSAGPVLYPAAYTPVLAVAASDQSDQRASYSNVGPQIDLAAPGSDIYSTWYRSNYFTQSGTSMAAPHVSGVLALLRSLHPDLSLNALRDLLCSSAVDIGTPGFDNYTGCGRLDAGAALGRAAGPADVWLALDTQPSVVAGEPIHYSVDYGNLGPGVAFGVVITSTLSVPGEAATQSSWSAGDLPPGGATYSRTIILPPQAAGVTITHTVEIASSSPELHPENNRLQSQLFVDYRLLLPLIFRK